MADLSDVERALVGLIAGALFPQAFQGNAGGVAYQAGAYQTTQGGITAKVVRGWPVQDALLADLTAGRAVVSVFSDPGMTRNVSRWFPAPMQGSTVAPTITATVSGAIVTLGGTATAGNVIGLQAGAPVRAYAYVLASSDTLASAATALAAKVSGASASGPVITLPTPLNVSAATMTPQPVLTVIRQQEQGVRVTIWAPTPAVRDSLVSLIDPALSGLRTPGGALTAFFAVTANESARIAYRATYSNDQGARDKVWRRDLVYTIEFATTLIEQDPLMLFGGGTATLGSTGATRQIGDVLSTANATTVSATAAVAATVTAAPGLANTLKAFAFGGDPLFTPPVTLPQAHGGFSYGQPFGYFELQHNDGTGLPAGTSATYGVTTSATVPPSAATTVMPSQIDGFPCNGCVTGTSFANSGRNFWITAVEIQITQGSSPSPGTDWYFWFSLDGTNWSIHRDASNVPISMKIIG